MADRKADLRTTRSSERSTERAEVVVRVGLQKQCGTNLRIEKCNIVTIYKGYKGGGVQMPCSILWLALRVTIAYAWKRTKQMGKILGVFSERPSDDVGGDV